MCEQGEYIFRAKKSFLDKQVVTANLEVIGIARRRRDAGEAHFAMGIELRLGTQPPSGRSSITTR